MRPVQRVASLLLALGSVACSDHSTPFQPAVGSSTSLHLVLREEVQAGDRTAWRELALGGEGELGADGRLELDVATFHHRAEFADGRTLELRSDEPVIDPTGLRPEELELLVVLTGALRKRLVLTLDPSHGLRELDGLDAALAGTAATPEARAGLEGWIDDERVRDLLRAAGFQRIREDLSDLDVDVRRSARVPVPAWGFAWIELRGESGEDADGSPTARYQGRATADAQVEGELPGRSIGAVVVERIECRGTSLHDADSWRPLRGSFRYELPFDADDDLVPDVTVARSVEFTWLVEGR